MAKKVAVINMKGGVGKSTLCNNLGCHFAAMQNWGKRVLVVDLDPQFNLSQYTLGVHRYQKDVISANRPTIWDIFEQAARTPGLKASGRNLTDAILPVTRYTNGGYLHLIPSQLELSFTLKNPSEKAHLLANFLSDVEDNYDLILIDCAPTESVLTTAAYQSVDSILIPVKPEFLSTIGLPLIKQSLSEFATAYRKKVKVAGIVLNMCSNYNPEEMTSKSEVIALAATFGWHMFSQDVPYSRSFPKGAREGSAIFNTSYAHSSVATKVANFCNAFAARIGL